MCFQEVFATLNGAVKITYHKDDIAKNLKTDNRESETPTRLWSFWHGFNIKTNRL
jgi:hypothetical protein